MQGLKKFKRLGIIAAGLAFALIGNAALADPNGGRDMDNGQFQGEKPSPVSAPEIDGSTLPLMATLLVGGIAVFAGRRRS